MSDPRNVAHDKKVISEKLHNGEDLTSGAAHVPQPGKKTPAAEKKHEPANHHDPAQNYEEGTVEHPKEDKKKVL